MTDDKEGPGSNFQKHLPDVRSRLHPLVIFHCRGNSSQEIAEVCFADRDPDHHTVPPRLPHLGSHQEGSQAQALRYSRCRWVYLLLTVAMPQQSILGSDHVDLNEANNHKITVAEGRACSARSNDTHRLRRFPGATSSPSPSTLS